MTRISTLASSRTRYGCVPKGHELSITEMEYNRAVERGIPRLLYLMDKAHPITVGDTEEDTEDEGDKARRKSKLRALKDTMRKDSVVNFFKSPEDFTASW